MWTGHCSFRMERLCASGRRSSCSTAARFRPHAVQGRVRVADRYCPTRLLRPQRERPKRTCVAGAVEPRSVGRRHAGALRRTWHRPSDRLWCLFGSFVALNYALRHPPLLLAGELDPMITIAVAEDLAAALPAEQLRFHRFPDAGHMLALEQPEAAFSASSANSSSKSRADQDALGKTTLNVHEGSRVVLKLADCGATAPCKRRGWF